VAITGLTASVAFTEAIEPVLAEAAGAVGVLVIKGPPFAADPPRLFVGVASGTMRADVFVSADAIVPACAVPGTGTLALLRFNL